MRAARWVRGRVGPRGAALLFFAGLDFVFAQGLLCAPPKVRASDTYAFLATILPLWAWAIPWGVVGLVCLVYAFRDRHLDRPAFAAATALKVGWGTLHLTGWLLDAIPRGYIAAAVWLAFAALVQVIARMDRQPQGG